MAARRLPRLSLTQTPALQLELQYHWNRCRALLRGILWIRVAALQPTTSPLTGQLEPSPPLRIPPNPSPWNVRCQPTRHCIWCRPWKWVSLWSSCPMAQVLCSSLRVSHLIQLHWVQLRQTGMTSAWSARQKLPGLASQAQVLSPLHQALQVVLWRTRRRLMETLWALMDPFVWSQPSKSPETRLKNEAPPSWHWNQNRGQHLALKTAMWTWWLEKN